MTTNGGYKPLTKEEQFENMKNFCSDLYKENEALKKWIKDNLPDSKNKPKFNDEEENCSPYCELCGGCGEDGCCNHLMCFRTLIQNPKCEYGITYLKDAQFANDLYKLGFETIEKLKNKEMTADDAVIEYEKNYDLIYDKLYGKMI
jgi:hypothetical protein